MELLLRVKVMYAAAATAAAGGAWDPHQEKSVCEDGEDLPARIIRMAGDAAMQLPAARLKRQIIAAKCSQALKACVTLCATKSAVS